MKIAIAQQNYHIGNFEYNQKIMLDALYKAKEAGADLVVFPELSVCGYPPRDFLEHQGFLDACFTIVETIKESCYGIAAIIGCPLQNPAPEGKRWLNAALFISEGKITFEYHKALLPDYDVFDEYRYFEPGKKFELFSFKGYKIGLTICEDLWDLGDNPLYPVHPMSELAKHTPDLIINIAASPFHYRQANIRVEKLGIHSKNHQLPIIYVNQVGSQTELIFDGGSFVMNSKGQLIKQLSFFEEDFCLLDFPDLLQSKTSTVPMFTHEIQLIHQALILGIRDYFGKMGFKKAVLGLSGGIDSAVVLALAVEALGNQNVLSILMPSPFSSEHSVSDAIQLCENLKCPYQIIPIEKSFQAVNETLGPYFENLNFDLTEENIQARLRAVILMAFSNKFGYITLNTSNKSEAAVGYGTLYGDMCGGISILGDVYKTQVWELAADINKPMGIIPETIISKPPSAELRPGQLDSDSLPDYKVLDKILFEYIENSKDLVDITAMGFPADIVLKTLKLVNSSEYKRYQTPPILRVSCKAFGMGRRMPIVAQYN